MGVTFPGAVPSYPDTGGNETLGGAGGGLGLSRMLDDFGLDISAIAAKLGTGASTPTANKVLRSSGTGSSVWGAVDLTTDITGTLPVGNGGTGLTALGSGVGTFLGTPSSANLAAALTDETGTGSAVFANSPTITTPTIASFVNANHDHQASAGGGILDDRAIALRNNQPLLAKNAANSNTPVLELHSDDRLRLSQLPRQDNTTNSVSSDVLIQYGYGVFATGAASAKDETVTFPISYDAAPIVIISPGGDDTGGATTLGSGNVDDQRMAAYAYLVTTTNFIARCATLSGTNWAVGSTVFYHWVAIGAKA